MPARRSLIYLQPVYLQSTGSAFPEFQRIVVASPRQVVWGRPSARRSGSCCAAEEGDAPIRPDADPDARPDARAGRVADARRAAHADPTTGPAEPLPADVAGLIDYANRHFELAQAALRDGDFARYGDGDRAGRGGPRAAR